MFDKIFEGKQSAYGLYILPQSAKSKPDEYKKQKGKAQTVKKPITKELYDKHIAGEQGLGIIPINDDGDCNFGAIDIDTFVDLREMEQSINNLKLPLIVCRTKSGGAHLYLFLKQPTSANIVNPALKSFAERLGFPKVEIFPKQLKTTKRDIGNWINLPYYGGDKTDRYAIRNGKQLTLSEFIVYAKHKSVTQDELQTFNSNDSIFNQGPPCLNIIAIKGIGEGERNITMFNVGVYYKKAYPDEWEDKLEKYNDKLPKPLPSTEIIELQRQLSKDKYFYQCDQLPLATYCDKESCKKQQFGVGRAANESRTIEMKRISKVDTDPPLWLVDVDDITLTLSTEQLTEQRRFIKACVEQLNKMPKAQKDWASIVDELLSNVQIIPAPIDAGFKGQLDVAIEEFFSLHVNADSLSDVMHSLPFFEGSVIMWRSQDMIDYLSTKGIKITPNRLYARLRSMNVDTVRKAIPGYAGKSNLWCLPYTKQEVNDESEY